MKFFQYLMRQVITRQKRLKIRTKLFITILCVSLLMIILPGSIFQYISIQILFNNTRSFTGEFLEQLSYNLENSTDNLLESTYEMMKDADLNRLLTEDGKDASQMHRYRQNMRALGSRHFQSEPKVYAVYVVNETGNLTWWVKYARNFNYSNVTEEFAADVIETAKDLMEEKGKNTLWFLNPKDGRVYLARNLIDVEEQIGYVYGTIVFAVDESFFCPIESDRMLVSNENLVFYNAVDDLVYTQLDMDDMVQQYVKEEEQTWGNGISQIRYGGENYIYARRIKNSTSWNIYCFIPARTFMAGVQKLEWYILLVAGTAVLFSLAVSSYFSKNLSKNVHYLERNMRKIESGDFQIHIEPISYDEIGMLCERFNCMADKIQELIQKAYYDGQAKQKLKLQVLKAQINPHFLYNSLGSIRGMAKMRHQDDIVEMTTALIELLRGSLGKTGEYHTVRKEIEYIRNYFTLQMYRYEGCFEVVYDLAPETEDCIMLNFILQPLVENAIFHGIEISKGEGLIRITSAVVEGKLRLTVEDNGVGMTEEKIKTILTVQEEKYEGLNSIGVMNVSQRIKQYFGEEYGLSYISEPGKGSIAQVWLPLFFSLGDVKENV